MRKGVMGEGNEEVEEEVGGGGWRKKNQLCERRDIHC